MSYLDNHLLLASQDLSELRELLSDKNDIQQIETVGKQTEIDVKVCGVFVDGMHLANFEYGGGLTKFHTYEGEGANALQLIVTSSGTGQTQYRNQNYVMARNVGFMRDMGAEHVSSLENIDGLGLSINVDRIKNHARKLIGQRADLIEPEFETNFDMTTPAGIHLRNTLAYVSSTMNLQVPEIHNEIVMKSLGDLLLTHILQLIPNSYSSLLNGKGIAKPIPRYLKRARDYIHAHAATPITLEALADHAGCGYRTLQVAFNEAYGMSPMAYVNHVRLTNAHDDLVGATDGTTVRDIALKWGFTHMGWFSKKYMEQFGASPSQTLRMRG